jgi:hypothetical protein
VVYWQKFDPAKFAYEFDEEELAGHDAKVSFASLRVGRISRPVKKVSPAEIEGDLLADARNESAWEEPVRT